jgi:hypothetical protein
MRYIIDIERNEIKIEVERINEFLCMITSSTPDEVAELVLNQEQLYELIGSLHLVQNQMKKK